MPRDRAAGDLLDRVRADAGDLLERVRAEIHERLGELRPHVEEHQRLLAAAESLALEESTTNGRGHSRATPVGSERSRPVPTKSASKPRASAKPASVERRSAKRTSKGQAPSGQGPQGETQQAITAALEHGSHTLAELVLVTAIGASSIRAQLNPLKKAGLVGRVSREGKTAYTLLSATVAASEAPKKGASAK